VITIGLHAIGLVAQVAEIGDHHVNPEHIMFGKHDPGVHDQDRAAVLEEQHVLADLPQAAQGQDAQCVCHNKRIAHPQTFVKMVAPFVIYRASVV